MASFISILLAAPAWWDGGHMLTAEVARLSLTPSEVAILEEVLFDWETSFPGTSSLSAAAIWADLLKCSHAASYCHTERPPAISAFSQWHFNDKPYNPDGLPLAWPSTAYDGEIMPHLWKGNPSATYLLSQAVRTFQMTKSRWSVNYMLRFALHLVGDVHQPLHTTEGFFNDTTYGELPHGDHGGNLIRIANPEVVGGASNLHAVWDSTGGLYGQVNWPLSESEQHALAANASAIMSAYPPHSLAIGGGGGADAATLPGAEELTSCWSAGSSGGGCEDVFLGWIDEMHAIALQSVYPGAANGGMLNASYVANVRSTCQRQIALGGYRLAGFLRLVLERSGEWQGDDAPPARSAADGKYIHELERELAMLGGLTVVAFVLAGIMALLLGRVAWKKRARAAHIRALAHKQMVELQGVSGTF